MNLSDVNSGIHKHKKVRRVGRGVGSGRGKTAGRGHKGQRAMAGYSALPIYQGGTTPMVRRVPKRGFHNRFALRVATVNLADLDRVFTAGEEVSPETLRAKSLVKRRYDELKILGTGELTKSLTVAAHRFSSTAREKIEKAGGAVMVIPGRKPMAAPPPSEPPSEASSSESAPVS